MRLCPWRPPRAASSARCCCWWRFPPPLPLTRRQIHWPTVTPLPRRYAPSLPRAQCMYLLPPPACSIRAPPPYACRIREHLSGSLSGVLLNSFYPPLTVRQHVRQGLQRLLRHRPHLPDGAHGHQGVKLRHLGEFRRRREVTGGTFFRKLEGPLVRPPLVTRLPTASRCPRLDSPPSNRSRSRNLA